MGLLEKPIKIGVCYLLIQRKENIKMRIITILNQFMNDKDMEISLFDKNGNTLLVGNAEDIYKVSTLLFREALIKLINFDYENDYINIFINIEVVK